MRENLLKIINHYGVLPQLKYFQSEVFELNEAVITHELNKMDGNKTSDEGVESLAHVAEEIADCYVMLEQIRQFYCLSTVTIDVIMHQKIKRQLERIQNEK